MSTTSARLGRAAVAGLVEAGLPLALLHDTGLPDDDDSVSDIDLVVGIPPATILSLAGPAWSARGLFPIIAWPYDVGGTMSLFLASADVRDGVQLDLLHDPRGGGRYGIRSSAALAASLPGPDAPVLAEPARIVYLWRKRTEKGDDLALRELRTRALDLDQGDLRRMSASLTGSESVADEIRGDIPPRRTGRIRMMRSRLRRAIPRLVEPVGFWAHTESAEVAEELKVRLSRFLTPVGTGQLPGLAMPAWYLTKVAPVRLRPGVFISYGAGTPGRADGLIGSDPETAASSLVQLMAQRFVP